nr:MAG TPA: hypothetical protein [Caudoviricetes sp.]
MTRKKTSACTTCLCPVWRRCTTRRRTTRSKQFNC